MGTERNSRAYRYMQTDEGQPAAPTLIVKRGRLGNFRFSFAAEHGKLNGTVTVEVTPGQSHAEAENAAHRKIFELIRSFAEVTR